jgi:hypothetical protein
MASGFVEGRAPPAPYKSWTEFKIARFLEQVGLAFKYEKPTAVVDDGKTKLWHPDFSLACGPVIEFFGLMDNPDYAAGAQHKLKIYRDNGIHVLALYPDDLSEGWQERVLVWIEGVMEYRMNLFRRAAGFPSARQILPSGAVRVL